MVFNPAFTAFGQEVLFVVAFLPFIIPALAARADPVQMVRTCLTLGAVFAMYSNVAFSVGLRQPGPPARIKTSNVGAVSKVCVGGSTGYTEELNGFMAAICGSDVTGSIVSAIRAISILYIPLRNCRISIGPWTSSKSNMRKSTMPYVRGKVSSVPVISLVFGRRSSFLARYVLTGGHPVNAEMDKGQKSLKDPGGSHRDRNGMLIREHQRESQGQGPGT